MKKPGLFALLAAGAAAWFMFFRKKSAPAVAAAKASGFDTELAWSATPGELQQDLLTLKAKGIAATVVPGSETAGGGYTLLVNSKDQPAAYAAVVDAAA